MDTQDVARAAHIMMENMRDLDRVSGKKVKVLKPELDDTASLTESLLTRFYAAVLHLRRNPRDLVFVQAISQDFPHLSFAGEALHKITHLFGKIGLPPEESRGVIISGRDYKKFPPYLGVQFLKAVSLDTTEQQGAALRAKLLTGPLPTMLQIPGLQQAGMMNLVPDTSLARPTVALRKIIITQDTPLAARASEVNAIIAAVCALK